MSAGVYEQCQAAKFAAVCPEVGLVDLEARRKDHYTEPAPGTPDYELRAAQIDGYNACLDDLVKGV